MLKSNQTAIRAYLRANPDGAPASVISRALGVGAEGVRQALGRMPDVCIDRWVIPARGPLMAVWCAVEVPANCPRPERKRPVTLQTAWNAHG